MPLAVLGVRRVVDRRVRELATELLVEGEEGDLAALELLPGAVRSARRAGGAQAGGERERVSALPSLGDEVSATAVGGSGLHGAVDVVVRDAVLSLVRSYCYEGAAADDSANLWDARFESEREVRTCE